MKVYPVELLIEGIPCVVIGGGPVAERKAQALLAAGARVKVIAPEVTCEIARLAAEGQLEWCRQQAREADIAEAFIVIAASDDRALNSRIAVAAKAAGQLVNVVDEPEGCNFFVPAVVRRGPVIFTVSTGGKSPALAGRLRRDLESRYGPEWGLLAQLLGRLRPEVQAAVGTQAQRAEVWERILDSPVLELLREGRVREAEALARKLSAPEEQFPLSSDEGGAG